MSDVGKTLRELVLHAPAAEMLSFVTLAVHVLEAIEKVTLGNARVEEALTTIAGVVDSFREVVEGKAASSTVHVELDKVITDNDARADAALAAKFPPDA